LEFNVPFQHKYGYIRDDLNLGSFTITAVWLTVISPYSAASLKSRLSTAGDGLAK